MKTEKLNAVDSKPWVNCIPPCKASCLGVPKKIGVLKNDSFAYQTVVIPNPAKKIITISIKSEKNGKLNFIIFDILGNKIYENVFNKRNYKLSFNINMNNYPAGVYHYRFIDSNNQVKNGSFVIKR